MVSDKTFYRTRLSEPSMRISKITVYFKMSVIMEAKDRSFLSQILLLPTKMTVYSPRIDRCFTKMTDNLDQDDRC